MTLTVQRRCDLARRLLAPCLLLLAGCAASHTGDFGRRADNVVTSGVLPKLGIASAWMRGEPVSLYPFTDDEIELRDRAWRFLMPSHDKANLQMKLAELSYTRILPPIPHSGHSHYHLLLMAEDYRSVASRYQKLGEDVESDRQLMIPFSQAAARVCAADRVRIQSLNHVQKLSETQRASAVARVAENRMLVDWVRRDMRDKAAAYRYAVEHIAIEAPMREAIRAEQAVIALESAQQTLDYWDGCGENVLAVPPGGRGDGRGGAIKDAERYAPASPKPIDDARGRISTRPPK
ncbi:MAG: hypothetical protein ACRC7G_05305 [Beijerinckiaceae bacterium]